MNVIRITALIIALVGGGQAPLPPTGLVYCKTCLTQQVVYRYSVTATDIAKPAIEIQVPWTKQFVDQNYWFITSWSHRSVSGGSNVAYTYGGYRNKYDSGFVMVVLPNTLAQVGDVIQIDATGIHN